MYKKIFLKATVYETPLDESAPFSPSLLSVLSEEEQRDISRLPENKRVSVLYAHLLLRMLLFEETKLFERPLFSRDGYGKLHLPAHPEVHFNISHTVRAAAAALCLCPVGVDVERIRPVPETILPRIFTEEERSALPKGREREKALISLWTRKEAYSKMLGKGLTFPLSFSTIGKSGIFTKEREDYVLSLAVKEPALPVFTKKSVQDIIHFFSAEILPKKD